MASDAWISELADIHKAKGWVSGSPVDVEDILKAFSNAGMTEDEQAELLAGFMAATDVKPAEEPPATTLTLAEIIQMVRDPSKHADIVAQFNKLTPEQQAELKAQVLKLKPLDTAPAPDVDTQKLVQPVLNAIQSVQTIATSGTPKRTKMLDVIDSLNKILPSPALNMKDEKGITYSEQLISVLNANKDRFGTSIMPGDQFLKIVTPFIKSNKPVELDQAYMESELHNLRRAAGIV